MSAASTQHRCSCPSGFPASVERDSASGTRFCADCGTVLEENEIVAEVQFVEGGNGGRAALGSSINANTQLGRNAFGSNSGRSATVEARQIIAGYAAALHLQGESIIAHAERIYTLAYMHRLTRGKKRAHMCAVCLYISLRRNNVPIMLIELGDLAQASVFKLGALFMELRREFPSVASVEDIDPSVYISRFAQALEFGDKTRAVSNDALLLVKRMKRDWIADGRRPAGICGAALLIAARMHHFHRTVKEVVQVVKMSDATVAKRIKEFAATPAAQLSAFSFRTLADSDDVSTSLPPSYIRNRITELRALEEQGLVLPVTADDDTPDSAAATVETASASAAASTSALDVLPTPPMTAVQARSRFATDGSDDDDDDDDEAMELDDDDDDVENGNGDAGDENGLDATSAAATRSIKRAEGLLKSNILGLARKLLMQPSRATRAPAAAAGAAPTAIASSSSQSVAPEEEGGASSDGSEGTILASARRQRARSGSSTPTRGTRGDGGGIGSENDDADKEEEPAPVPRARRSGAAKRRRGQPATVAGVPLAKMIEALAQVIPANPSTRGHFAAPQTDAMELVPALPAETAALSEIKPMSVLAQEHRHAMNLARAQALAVEAAASGLTPSVVSDSLDAQALATPEVAATAVRTVPRTTADFLTHINLSDANRGRVELTAADADLSDLDDDPDVSRSIVTEPAEIEARECIWNQANWDWMAAQAERQKIRDAARVSGMPLRKRQRRGPNSKSADGSERVGWTASDAARTAGDGHNVGDRVLMTAKSRVSTKINPEALREIFGDAESAAAGGPAVTEEAAYDGGEGYGYDEDYYGEEEAAAPYDMYAVGDDDGHEEV